jgi:hypothetical protein
LRFNPEMVDLADEACAPAPVPSRCGAATALSKHDVAEIDAALTECRGLTRFFSQARNRCDRFSFAFSRNKPVNVAIWREWLGCFCFQIKWCGTPVPPDDISPQTRRPSDGASALLMHREFDGL